MCAARTALAAQADASSDRYRWLVLTPFLWGVVLRTRFAPVWTTRILDTQGLRWTHDKIKYSTYNSALLFPTSLVTASQPPANHLKTLFFDKMFFSWPLESWNPWILLYRLPHSTMFRTYSLVLLQLFIGHDIRFHHVAMPILLTYNHNLRILFQAETNVQRDVPVFLPGNQS